MRTVVIIAPDFSPSSLPSSIRPRLFANHLKAFGWHAVVLTTSPEFYECPLDMDNEKLVESHVEVVRTEALHVASARRFGFGDIGMRSFRAHWKAIRTMVARRTVDLILISVPPSVPMVLGWLARRTFGIPYVLDYQDPWVTDAWWKVPRSLRPPKWPLAWAMARVLEPWSVRSASALTGVSSGAFAYAASLQPGILTAEIPFGAEPAEFTFLRAHPRRNPVFEPRDGKLHLVYTGAVIPGMYPSIRVLLEGVRLLQETYPTLAARLKIHFVGTSYAARGAAPQVLPIALDTGLIDLVTEHVSRVSYLDALQILLDSTALVILGTTERHYNPSKIFPCALAARPILALLHEGGTGPELLRGITGTAAIVFGDSGPGPELVPEICARLVESLTEGSPAEPNQLRLEPFTARAMAGRLANIFGRVIESAASGTTL